MWSATTRPALAATAARTSASDLLFPWTTIHSGAAPAARAWASSPSEATSIPIPSSSSTRSRPTVALALHA